jgi:hypothetical protein
MASKHMGAIWMVAMVFVLLNIVLCNGGKTSSYVRKSQSSGDLPIDAFPPPPGFNAPEQVLSTTFLNFLDGIIGLHLLLSISL